MNGFITALCSNARNGRIPEEYDFFGCLIGEWDIVWNDHFMVWYHSHVRKS